MLVCLCLLLLHTEIQGTQIWTLLSLQPSFKYNVSTWALDLKCGIRENCENDLATWFYPGKGQNYCWNVYEKGNREYYGFNLSEKLVIAKIDDNTTITNHIFGHITNTYSENYHSTRNIIYIEYPKQIIERKHIESLNRPPKIIPNINNSRCNLNWDGWDIEMSYQLIEEHPEKAQKIFKYYVILHKPTTQSITSLDDEYLLTSTGLKRYQPGFEIFDLCNQKFLILQRDHLGRYYVSPNTYPVLCLAIWSHHNQLVLYEMQNFSTTWTWSTRYQGIISPNFYDRVDFTIPLSSDAGVKITLSSVEENSFIFEISSQIPLTCEIVGSPDISFSIVVPLKAEKKIMHAVSDSLSYNCSNGIVGTYIIQKENFYNFSSVDDPGEKNYNISPPSNKTPLWLWLILYFPYGLSIILISLCLCKKKSILKRSKYNDLVDEA